MKDEHFLLGICSILRPDSLRATVPFFCISMSIGDTSLKIKYTVSFNGSSDPQYIAFKPETRPPSYLI